MVHALKDILDAIRALPEDEREKLVETLRREYALDVEAEPKAVDPGTIIGLFSDEADLVDEVCASAMEARERDPLRLTNG